MFANKDVLTDEQLLKLYKNGDEESFKVLYGRHSSKIYGFLKKRLKHQEKVSEVYQEVFIKIHKSKHLYNESMPALAWIFTVTRTVMIDEIRKSEKLKIVYNYELESISDRTDTSTVNLDEAANLIKNLPTQQKAAIEMRYVDDKTFEEIAESLNVSQVNARQIISRGIKRIKELISEGDDRGKAK